MKQIKVKLSIDSIELAIEEIRRLKAEILARNEIFVQKLAEIGLDVGELQMRAGVGDSSREHTFEMTFDTAENKVTASIVLSGEDVLFWEFGAGIFFNNGNANPKGREFGYGVGTYPNQIHAFDIDGWYYRDENGLHHSLGTEATMPMYKASQAIAEEIGRIAMEVFGGM